MSTRLAIVLGCLSGGMSLLAQTPSTPRIEFVANNGSSTVGFSPGTLVNIFGQNLGPGSTVTVGGLACHINTSTARQLNVQFPTELAPGSAAIVVELQGLRSTPFNVRIDRVSPAIFTFGAGLDNELGRFVRANGTTVSLQNAPVPGETISLLGTGFGPTSPRLNTGQRSPGGVLLASPLTLLVGGRSVPVIFAGAAEGSIGINRVIFTLPGDLTPGSVSATVVIEGVSSNRVTLPITVTGLVVSQSGLTFRAVQGGSAPASRSFQILNGIQRDVSYSITLTTFSGSGWLRVSSPSGTLPGSGPAPAIDVSIDPAGLSAGDYYGQIRIDAPSVPNSPQFLSVVLNLNAPNVNPGPVLDTTGIVLVAVLNSTSPPAQAVRITNLLARPTTFRATPTFVGGRMFFSAAPLTGTVNPGQPAAISVAAVTGGLAAGVYRGALTIQFPDDNATRIVEVLLVVTTQVPAFSAGRELSRAADGCTPSRLLPVFVTLGAGFTTPAAWPASVELRVIDDCGGPMNTGSVDVTFSNSDPPLSLLSLQGGRWSATWTPRNARTADLRVTAAARNGALEGSTEIGGTLQSNEGVPVLNANGAVSAGSFSASAAPSPGELISIFGLRLADAVEGAQSLPLPTRLQTTSVVLAGRSLPLVFVADSQVNAVVPYDIPAGATHQLLVRRGNRISVPEPVAIQPVEPAVFTVSLSGKGQGHIYVAKAGGEQLLASPGSPAATGDVLVMYSTGLGAVTPDANAGEPAPSRPPSQTRSPVAVTIGGMSAPVQFAGLTPGFTGLYQVNARVPDGVPKGDQIPVVVTVGGVSCPAVTMAVQ